MTESPSGSLRHHHDFTVLWVGQTVSELGARVSMFAFPLVTYAITGSALAASLVQSAELVGLAGMLLPAGVLADRIDRRLLLRAASALGVIAYTSLTIIVVLGHTAVVPLAAAALCTGISAGLFGPAEISAVRTVVPQADLPAALSLNQGRQHVAGLVGGPLGGVLYGIGRSLPFAVDAASYLFSWVLLGRLRADLSPPVARQPRGSALADLRAGMAFVRRHRLLRLLAAWSFLTNLSMNALFMIAVLRMITSGTAPLHIGLVETAAGLCGVLGALIAPRLIARIPTGRLTIGVAWSAVPLVVPMAFWGSPVVVAAALGAVLLLNPAGNAGMQAYRAAVNPRRAGRQGAGGDVVHLGVGPAFGPRARRWAARAVRRSPGRAVGRCAQCVGGAGAHALAGGPGHSATRCLAADARRGNRSGLIGPAAHS